jgi:predicted ATPase
MFTLHIQNLRALRQVAWSPPPGVSVVVGPNGAGKTTLVLTWKLLRVAFARGLPQAVSLVLGGSHNLKNWQAGDQEVVVLGLDLDELSWRITLSPRGPTVDYNAEETLHENGALVFARDSLGHFQHRGEVLSSDDRLGLRAIHDAQRGDEAIACMVRFLTGITAYHDPDLWGLRQNGSKTTEDNQLASRGTNAFTLLRKWQTRKPDRHRYQFVLSGLKAAFPELCDDLDFEEAGVTLTARVFLPGREMPSYIAQEAQGLLAMLVLLCDVAAAEPGGVIAIDEPETSLHPFAIRTFLRRTRSWAERHSLTVILTSHSPALLNEVTPSETFTIRRGAQTVPVRADTLKTPAWLERFRLGDLYQEGELGANDDEA